MAQSRRSLAHARALRRDLLPQRNHLLRRPHAGIGGTARIGPARFARRPLSRPLREPVRIELPAAAGRPQHLPEGEMTLRSNRQRPAEQGATDRPVRVVIVDDSALARQLIRAMLGGDGSIEVVGSATDPTTAADIIRTKNPDVITLDVEMPNMDGLTFLEKIMRVKPTPVVMVSSLTERGADVTLQALELGAVDFVTKPRIDVARGFETKREELVGKIKAAAAARVRALAPAAPAAGERPKVPPAYRTTERIVAIGASTG